MASRTPAAPSGPRKPEPVNKLVVCSMCGLDWARHGASPTAEKCVELLKADIAKRPSHVYTGVSSFSGWPNGVTFGMA